MVLEEHQCHRVSVWNQACTPCGPGCPPHRGDPPRSSQPSSTSFAHAHAYYGCHTAADTSDSSHMQAPGSMQILLR